MSNIIELSNVKYYWNKHSSATIDIDTLEVPHGEHLFIKGPSGCGKSTLLGLLTGINQAQEGEVRLLDTELGSISASRRDRFRADHIGYIFQQFNLLPYLSVIDNVLLPCQFSTERRKRTPTPEKDHAASLLSSLQLSEELFSKSVIELSIGQQQRVAAARALIGAPEIIIADEPTSALDHENRKVFIELLMEQANKFHSTLVFVSHDPTLEDMFSHTVNLPTINKAGRTGQWQ